MVTTVTVTMATVMTKTNATTDATIMMATTKVCKYIIWWFALPMEGFHFALAGRCRDSAESRQRHFYEVTGTHFSSPSLFIVDHRLRFFVERKPPHHVCHHVTSSTCIVHVLEPRTCLYNNKNLPDTMVQTGSLKREQKARTKLVFIAHN